MTARSYADGRVQLHHGDCLDVLRTLPDNSVDAVVCDPPYGLANTTPEQVADTLIHWINGERDYLPEGRGFMGKSWDAFVPPVAVWDHCLRVLKPGGHLLAFAGSRTHDLMALGIRLAGFDIRDSIAWLYGSGFPKSLDVSKAIDKAAGATREVVGTAADFARDGAARRTDGSHVIPHEQQGGHGFTDRWSAPVTAPATPLAQQWAGWGTALKPAFEPIVVARKPLAGGTVAANVLAHGTGALNIDGCRVAHASEADRAESEAKNRHAQFGTEPGGNNVYGDFSQTPSKDYDGSRGRWPANVVLDDHAAAELDEQSGTLTSGGSNGGVGARSGRRSGIMGEVVPGPQRAREASSGGASRFFPVFRYQAKAPTRERPKVDGVAHPTCKPLGLMSWLVRLLVGGRPDAVVLEPFAGSGTTVEACLAEGVRCVAIEREAEYLPLIEARIARATELQRGPVVVPASATPPVTALPGGVSPALAAAVGRQQQRNQEDWAEALTLFDGDEAAS